MALNDGHTRTHLQLTDDVKSPEPLPDNHHFEMGVSEYTEKSATCPPVFYNSALIILLNVIFVVTITALLCHLDNRVVYSTLMLTSNWSLILTGLVMLIILIIDGSQNSISGIVAQRLKPKSYFAIIFICIIAVNTSNLMATMYLSYYLNSGTLNQLSQISFIFLYIGPLLMCLILVYPLIVRMPLYSPGFTDSIWPDDDHKIRLDAFKKVRVVTHTRSEDCANASHFLSVLSGVGCSWTGVIIELNNQPAIGCFRTELAFLILSIIFTIAFGIHGILYRETDIHMDRGLAGDANQNKPRINESIRFKNRIRITFEFFALWFVSVCQTIVVIDYAIVP